MKRNLNLKMGVSKTRGTPKSSILIGFSIINHPFWDTPFFGNSQIIIPSASFFLGPKKKTSLFRYFPKWLGPLFVGVYVAVYAPSVFSNAISLGTFLATIQIMKDISSEFAEAGKTKKQRAVKMTICQGSSMFLVFWRVFQMSGNR